MKRQSNLLSLHFFLKKSIAILFGLAMLLSCQTDLETIETITAKNEEPTESIYDLKIIQSSYASPKVIIEAPLMERYDVDDPFMELPEGLEVVFFDSLMKPSSRIRANYAISYDERNIIEAKNDVVAINEFNEKLNTEHLIWDQNEKIIYSEKFVKITTETEVLYGEGFESDERFEKWKIKNPTGTFTIEDPSTK